MNYRGRVRRVLLKTLANNPANFSVWVSSFPDKLRPARQDEVSFQALPDNMKLVASEPHVGARSSQRVFLALSVVGDFAFGLHRSDVGVIFKKSV